MEEHDFGLREDIETVVLFQQDLRELVKCFGEDGAPIRLQSGKYTYDDVDELISHAKDNRISELELSCDDPYRKIRLSTYSCKIYFAKRSELFYRCTNILKRKSKLRYLITRDWTLFFGALVIASLAALIKEVWGALLVGVISYLALFLAWKSAKIPKARIYPYDAKEFWTEIHKDPGTVLKPVLIGVAVLLLGYLAKLLYAVLMTN